MSSSARPTGAAYLPWGQPDEDIGPYKGVTYSDDCYKVDGNSRRCLSGGLRLPGKCALKPRGLGLCYGGDYFWARLLGYFAPCGARPEALPLDSATFEKVDETF